MESKVELSAWVITAVSGGGLTVLGFLLKHSFNQIQASLADISKELKTLSEEIGTVKSDVRVLESDLKHLTYRIETLEAEKK